MSDLIINNQLMKIVKKKKKSYSFCTALFENPLNNIK